LFCFFFYSGGDVIYSGRGDLHDIKYNTQGVRSSLFALKNQSKVMSTYTGIPIDEEFCTYTISVYPTKAYEQEFKTSNPIIFASFIVLVFIMVCISFLLYDSKVKQHQDVVMDSALRSNAVVSSLFPSAVRDKILNEANIDSGATTDVTVGHSMMGQIKSNYFKRTNKTNSVSCRDPTSDADFTEALCILDTPPIADLYPETTVFFADIAGFTQWSATRGPNDVFVMLETVYGSFDHVARSLGIFKVETIGDSYVAVVGLPTPRENHATVMVEFSRRILLVLKDATAVLVPKLGRDVRTLDLRIGLNSGPTTAGVLRGEKSRFQLFGDTVNTAARMESNGLPGRIHCSESTASCLKLDGNGSWLTQRDTLIEAKGKGTLQTYWVESEAEFCNNPATTKIFGALGAFNDVDDDSEVEPGSDGTDRIETASC
jgi:class 3 adenylate cyclase